MTETFRTGWLCLRCRTHLHGEHPAECPCHPDPIRIRLRILNRKARR